MLNSIPSQTECLSLSDNLLGVRWKRAKHWITSPDPDYVRKKNVGIA